MLNILVHILQCLYIITVVQSDRYYAFIELLFVIDKDYFPPLSDISYQDYVQVVVDSANISRNDLDIKVELINSKIKYMDHITIPYDGDPGQLYFEKYFNTPEYDVYDSIVLLRYETWDKYAAQGYAMMGGICDRKHKIMYLAPYQNAGMYLAHEIGHQLGLKHQINTTCFTDAHMSVMTNTHMNSYNLARWTECENNIINENICKYSCLFNQPNGYRPLKNKDVLRPGERISNHQQCKMIEKNKNSYVGENSAWFYGSSSDESSCLHPICFQSVGGLLDLKLYCLKPNVNKLMSSNIDQQYPLICETYSAIHCQDEPICGTATDFDTRNSLDNAAAYGGGASFGSGGFDATRAMFAQADTNQDGSLDASEFQRWAGGQGGANAYGLSGSAGYSSFQGDASQYGSGFDASLSAGGNLAAAGSYGGSLAGAGSYGASYDQASSSSAYGSSAGGVFNDPNPQIIRRPAASGPVTYQQNILVKFLQPPPVPPPGVSLTLVAIMCFKVKKCVFTSYSLLSSKRFDLRDKCISFRKGQRPPPPPVLPPIVIRENPPRPPPALPSQVVTKMLPALPVPPRSVIIERLPPLPPKPRDVIVERWLPYRVTQKRRVIVQRAPPVKQQKPRNIIIHYEAPRAQVVREFRNLGVQAADPREYLARYGASLEDSSQLVSHARQAGVVEDISPPAGAAFGSSSLQTFQSGGAYQGGIQEAGGYDLASSGVYDQSGASGGYSSAAYALQGGIEGAGAYGGGSGYQSSSESYGYGGGIASGASGFEAQSFGSTADAYGSGGVDAAAAAFRQADSNNDGTLDQEEFRRFAQGGF
ncbi:unnamed protein product [Didymodactylos carnosus]|uniref:EF-hand domain-containing protein n=1 Tax=Didymodactylos carnosus TaxID=1234261 RepID=A0A814B0K7_9BILA|nr:unnamed protein product [Didymodactylos carnosus]CAF0919982.1 unnamed protein product [Didymodactylos carnosus]CAF3533664.1 unnamed protein product [Didymodactylos carnosus]CAF3699433.1 unnamed protein product [Didymodactylos carnosus]